MSNGFENRVKIELFLNDVLITTNYAPEYRNIGRVFCDFADVYGIDNVALTKGIVSVMLSNDNIFVATGNNFNLLG